MGHSKHPFPTTQDNSTHGYHQMVNTKIRVIIFFGADYGEALYGQQNKTGSWLWLRLWAPYCKIQVWPNQIPYDYTVDVRDRFKGLHLIQCLKNWIEVQVHGLWYRRQWWKPSQRKGNAKRKMVVWIGLKNSREMKRSERQRKRWKIHPTECRVPEYSKKR